MKLLFIYLAVVFAICFYVWVNIIKEGNQDMSALNKLLASTYTNIPGTNRDGYSATEKDISPDILKSNIVTPGITTIDRYADPQCNKDEFIYCIDGQIECQDIFGDSINGNLQTMAPYISGNTFAKTCDSYINQNNLSDYTNNIDKHSNTGVYFDISNCSGQIGQWRVGTVGKDSTDSVESYTCHESQSAAENAMNLNINSELNMTTTYYKYDNIFILESYLKLQNSGEITQVLAVLNGNKELYKTINNQKYYYGKIEEVKGETYTVSINNGNIIVENVPKNALLKDSLYNKKSKDYYSDLKTGSHPRPICKSGRFTGCLSSPPFTIQNGVYISPDPSLTLYTDGSDPNQARKIQANNDFNSQTPFSTAPVNPSGIIDNPTSSILEYNYFNSQPETPFIKCIANYGSNIGDSLCCNQLGSVTDTKYICPEEVPTCRGYSQKDQTYGYCN